MPHYENVPFEIPEGWESVPVSDLFLLNPKSEIDDDTLCGFIPMALVEDGFSGNHLYEERIWKDIKKGYCHFHNGDIGIAKISPCFENRKSTIFENLPNGYGAGTTELVILRPIILYTKFYLYLFKSDWYIQEGTKYFKGVVGQQRVHKEIFKDLHIPLPSISEQHRIVTEIEKWFALIDQIEEGKVDLQETIKRTKNKILDLAIHGKLVPQDPNDEPTIELLKRINPDFTPCDNGHSEKLPNKWCYCLFKDVFIDITSKPYQILQSQIKDSGKYPVISQSANFIEGYSDENNVFQHKRPCIIFGDHTRNVKYIDFDFIVGADGVKILCPKVNEKWAYYSILYASSHIEKKGYSRHFGQIVQISMILPPFAEQQRIVQKIEELFHVLENIQSALEV